MSISCSKQAKGAAQKVNEQEKILIQRLKEADLTTKRFLKVGKPGCAIDEDKAAFEFEFQKHLYTPEELDSFPRWGILGCEFLVLIDSDDPRMYAELNRVLPNTFEVTSPRRGLPHKYLVVCYDSTGSQVPNKKLHLKGVTDEKGKLLDLGEVRADNHYLVAPGTVIRYIDKQTGQEKTGMYTITNNVPIARLEYRDFFNIIKPYIEEANGSIAQTITAEEMKEGVPEGSRHPKCLSYAGKLVWLGMDAETAYFHLKTWNETLCKPPLPDSELRRILKAVFGYSAEERGVTYQEALKGAEKKCLPIRLAENDKLLTEIHDDGKEISIDELREILDSTIKHDNESKLITFLDMLLNYTREDQQNIGYVAESSTGKSYIPLQLTPYFPKADVIELGRVNPTAFFHEWGISTTDPRDTREIEEEKKHKIIHVNLKQVILVFLDNPHAQLLQNLRPLLSHDREEIEVRNVDRSKTGSHRTNTYILHGFPTVIFCTANEKLDEQEKTRLTLLSPESTQEKLESAIILKIEKDSDREAYQKLLESDPKRKWLINRVLSIATAEIEEILIPIELRAQIFAKFKESHKNWMPRHQRDIGKLLALIKASALLNFKHREQTEKTITANLYDVENGFQLYSAVSESNELGLAPEIYREFLELKDDFLDPGLTLAEYQKKYYQKYHKLIGREKADNRIKQYLTVGLLQDNPDPNDRRKTRYMSEGVYVPENEQPTLDVNLPTIKPQDNFCTAHTPPPAYISKENKEAS
jgi:hypothetical protein